GPTMSNVRYVAGEIRGGSLQHGLRRVRGVVVEAAAALPPEVAPLDALLELARRAVLLLLGALVVLEPGVVADVEPGEIAEPEGAHRVVQAELHRLVDVGVTGHAVLEAVVRL